MAAKVLDLLENRPDPVRGKRKLRVAYLCSNARLAAQNLGELRGEDRKSQSGRPFEDKRSHSGRPYEFLPGSPQQRHVFLLTPRTAFAQGSGLARERRYMLLLLHELGEKIADWREFFRWPVQDEDRWRCDTDAKGLGKTFPAPSQRLLQKLRGVWFRPSGQEPSLIERARIVRTEGPRGRKRDDVIAEMRRALNMAVLQALDLDIVVLDEVQRFEDLVLKAQLPPDRSDEARFLDQPRVLVLSATPYQWSMASEKSDNYERWLSLLGFLRRRRQPGKGVDGADPLRLALASFEKRLDEGHFLGGFDPELARRKLDVERLLRPHVCRTERVWYRSPQRSENVLASDPSVQSSLPSEQEVAEYIAIRRFLEDTGRDAALLTDFWKSSPAFPAFMPASGRVGDGTGEDSYRVLRALRAAQKKRRIPRCLRPMARDLDSLSGRNTRFRELFRLLFAEHASGRSGWPFLWMRPCVTYYPDRFFGDEGPRKILLFSKWRFVPRAVAALASRHVDRLLGFPPPKLKTAKVASTDPLKEGPRRKSVCQPSPALAAAIDPAREACGRAVTPEQLVRKAAAALETRLATRQVAVIPGSKRMSAHRNAPRVPSWDAVERLESKPGDREWRTITRRQLRSLAEVACFSPAVCLLRAMQAAYPDEPTVMQEVEGLCLGTNGEAGVLQGYFTRPYVQAVIRAAEKKGDYFERVLAYCRDAHVQAVMDEYVHVLTARATKPDVAKTRAAIEAALGVGARNIQVQVADEGGAVGNLKVRVHFARTFGQGKEEDEEAAGAKSGSKSTADDHMALQRAFNSPFWPFLLATTSVGQEGMDFHLYCKDVVHWNLPENPVDLEQREGRIDRRDGLAVRRAVSGSHRVEELARTTAAEGETRWEALFRCAVDEPEDPLQLYKHGLYPHWVFGDGTGIRSHVLAHRFSKDLVQYSELRRQLALYRVVYALPQPKRLVTAILKKCEQQGIVIDERQVRQYSLNLLPYGPGYARDKAREEARRIATDPEKIQKLVDDVGRLRAERAPALRAVEAQLDALVAFVKCHKDECVRRSLPALLRSLTALEYFRNPYDDTFDEFTDTGLLDDAMIIREAGDVLMVDPARRSL